MRVKFFVIELIGILSCTILFGCEKPVDIVTEEFLYLNESSSEIDIEYYFGESQNIVHLDINESFIQVQKTPDVNREYIINADSLIIIFSDTSRLTYVKNESNDDGILDRINYDYEKIEERHHRYSYVIDNMDY
ncbi:hypothetical protein [Marivirga sp.]|uniref:hypothetical protein n=1 Tax=Marivirga sp. TaxID=2018662 RepID=UPI003DA6EBFE